MPTGYLIPPIPGRLDYLWHVWDVLSEQLHSGADAKLNKFFLQVIYQ
ncbi:RlmF-related methyltransferase [Mariniflexile sp. HMF6888]